MRKIVRQRLKYYYYKMLCRLLGKDSFAFRSGLAKLIPGKSAVLLLVKGKNLRGYSKWLKRNAQFNKVTCWIKKVNKRELEILIVGSVKNIIVVAQLASRKESKNTRMEIYKQRWFNKQDYFMVPEIEDTSDKKFAIIFAGNFSHGDCTFSKELKTLTSSNDHFIVNLSVTQLNSPITPIEKSSVWKENLKKVIAMLKQMGVTAVNMVSDNDMDLGAKPMALICNLLNNAGIRFVGKGSNASTVLEPLRLEIKGRRSVKRVYIYNDVWVPENPGINHSRLDRMLLTISALRQKEPDVLIIVCPHWQGYKHRRLVSPVVKDICRKLIIHGADLVIAHGTRYAHHFEKTSKGTIAYSIGNFALGFDDDPKSSGLSYSMLAKINVYENNGEWKIAPKFYPVVWSKEKGKSIVRLVDEKECLGIYNELTKVADNTHEFATLHTISKDNHGYYISVDCIEWVWKLKEAIFKGHGIEKTDFRDLRTIASYIDQLRELHCQLDERFASYYNKLFRSKHLSRRENSDYLISLLGKVTKREYVNFHIRRKFSQRRISIRKAISFKDIIVETTETGYLGCTNYAHKLDRKDVAYKFADAIGLRRPATDSRIYKFAEIAEQKGPAVIKPVNATGGVGIYLIFDKNRILSVNDGVYLDSWSALTDSVFEKKKKDVNRERKFFERDEWMVEELILGTDGPYSPPNDLKFYTFYGEILLVSESNPAYRKRFCYWDAEMNPVKTGRYDNRSFSGSGFTEEELKIAIETSLQIPAPFVRLDMLKGQQGLVFCEATSWPGGYHSFNDKYDRLLGEAYRRAEDRILRDLLGGKKFDVYNRLF